MTTKNRRLPLEVRETPQHTTTALLCRALSCSTEAAEGLMQLTDGSFRKLASYPAAHFERVPGIGMVKADILASIIELSRRFSSEAADGGVPLRGPRDVAAVFAPRMQDLPVEEFHVAILDAQHRLERDVLITRGLLSSSLVHPREVFREAIAERAAAIIIVHNHPSGDPTPSAEDKAVTRQLVEAGRLLDIPVHDHIIIGKGRYVSFTEAGLI